MQRRASSSYGATMAPVGHAPMQAVHVPQWSDLRIGRGQRQVGVDLAQEEIRAHVARQQQRVLAAPAQARLGRERDFEHRRAVGEHAVAEFAHGIADAIDQPLQPRAQYLVVVATQRVARDVRGRSIGQDRARIGRRGRPVIHACGDDANGARHEVGRAGARGAVPRHVVHRPVPAGGEPAQEVGLFCRKFGVADADVLESEFSAPERDLPGERGPVALRGCRRAGAGIIHRH